MAAESGKLRRIGAVPGGLTKSESFLRSLETDKALSKLENSCFFDCLLHYGMVVVRDSTHR
jgi:hypothetical protein